MLATTPVHPPRAPLMSQAPIQAAAKARIDNDRPIKSSGRHEALSVDIPLPLSRSESARSTLHDSPHGNSSGRARSPKPDRLQTIECLLTNLKFDAKITGPITRTTSIRRPIRGILNSKRSILLNLLASTEETRSAQAMQQLGSYRCRTKNGALVGQQFSPRSCQQTPQPKRHTKTAVTPLSR